MKSTTAEVKCATYDVVDGLILGDPACTVSNAADECQQIQQQVCVMQMLQPRCKSECHSDCVVSNCSLTVSTRSQSTDDGICLEI